MQSPGFSLLEGLIDGGLRTDHENGRAFALRLFFSFPCMLFITLKVVELDAKSFRSNPDNFAV